MRKAELMKRALQLWAWLMFAVPSVIVMVIVPVTPGHGEERTALSAQDAGSTAMERVEAQLLEEARSSPAWAGSWRNAAGMLVLAFTDRSDDIVHQLLSRVGAPAIPVRAQQVRFTLRELRAVDARMYELATSGAGFQTVHAWSVRPERNRVVAYTGSPDQARAEFIQAGIDIDKVEFQKSRGQLTYQPLACSRTKCVTEPMRGGLAWFSSRGACTTGFGATRNGVEGFLSAGHCASPGSRAFVGQSPSGTFYGHVLKRAQKTNADALFVGRDSSYPSGSRVGIYLSREDPQHTITAREPTDGYGNGQRTCFSGVVSGYGCGTIFDGSFTDTQLGLRDVVLTDQDACATFGDSGAPFFAGSTAQGILSGIVIDPGDPFQQCIHSVYTKLRYGEQATGAQIMTG
jgi:streptogrisin C